ncbi:MAG: two-component regulator propeller domain-containing protein [Prevotella sp.]
MQFKTLRQFLIVLFLFTFLSVVKGQVAVSGDMCYVTKEDGLSGLSGGKTITDHLGRVWVATTNGVTMYNGVQTCPFPISSSLGTPLSVLDLIEMQDGTIYVTTKETLFALRPGQINFEVAFPAIKHPTSLLLQGDNLYVGSYDGFFVINNGSVRKISTGYPSVSSEDVVYALQGDRLGNVWFLTSAHANCYNPRTNRRSAVDLSNLLPSETKCNQFYIGSALWFFGTKSNGLFCYDSIRHTMRHVEGVGNVICSINVDNHGTVCVSADGDGAYRINPRTAQIEVHFGKDETGRHRLATDGVYYYRRDAEGVDWFGLNSLGVAHSYFSYPLFQLYSYGPFTTAGQFVKGFYVRGSVRIIGMSDELAYIDEARNIVKVIPCSAYGDSHAVTNIIFWRGKYYIGTYDAGLHVLDGTTLTFEPQRVSPVLDNCTVLAMAESPDGNLWVGSSQGLFIYTPDGKTVRYTEQNSKVPGSSITGIVFDRQHNAWISSAKGFALYFPSKHYFEDSHFPSGFFNTFEGLTVVPGHGNLLYAYTNQKVFYTDFTMSKFGELSLPQGLMGERCSGFLDDGRGHFWLSTENGLFRIDSRTQGVSRFGRAAGLSGGVINKLLLDDKNRLWLSSDNGLYMLNASRLSQWNRRTNFKFLLYHIMVGGTRFDFAEETRVNNEHKLRVGWNVISEEVHMQPVIEDFSMAKGRLYEYRLGSSDHWQLISGHSDITLKNLQLGSYTLHLRLAGMPGTECQYKVTVLPTTIAFAELFLLLFFIVVVFYIRRYHHDTQDLLTERDDMERALMEADQQQQKEEEQEELKDESEQQDKNVSNKYQHLRLDEKESADIVRRMNALMEQKKLYLNPYLKLGDLANALQISTTRLSQIFTQVVGQNYYDYVNGYRLCEFKHLIAEGEYKRFTLISLSEKCGFKKTSFFSTFHKVEGMTPTEYLKKVK